MLYHAIEGGILSILFVFQSRSLLATLLSDKDWERLSGTAGLSFASTIAVMVLWVAFLAFIHRTYKRDDIRRREDMDMRKAELAAKDRHHNEVLALQEKNSDKILALNAEVIKAHQISISTNAEVARALRSWKKRPCLLGEIDPDIEPVEEEK